MQVYNQLKMVCENGGEMAFSAPVRETSCLRSRLPFSFDYHPAYTFILSHSHCGRRRQRKTKAR